jgi:hypothetical protein
MNPLREPNQRAHTDEPKATRSDTGRENPTPNPTPPVDPAQTIVKDPEGPES